MGGFIIGVKTGKYWIRISHLHDSYLLQNSNEGRKTSILRKEREPYRSALAQGKTPFHHFKYSGIMRQCL